MRPDYTFNRAATRREILLLYMILKCVARCKITENLNLIKLEIFLAKEYLSTFTFIFPL